MTKWDKAGRHVLWSRSARPVVVRMSAAGNLRAEEEHDVQLIKGDMKVHNGK
jgi:hypothetical protein